MWNATIGAEELANISSYQTLWGDKNWEKLLSNHEARFISCCICAHRGIHVKSFGATQTCTIPDMGASCTLYSPSQNSAVTLKVGLVPQQNTTPSLKCSSFLKKASTTTKLSLINLQVEMQRQCCCACGPWSAELWFLIFTRWSKIQIVHYQEICVGPTVAWFQVDWASVQCSAGCEGIGTWWSEHLAWKYWTPSGRLQHQHYNAHVVWEQNCTLRASSIGYCCWIEDCGS